MAYDLDIEFNKIKEAFERVKEDLITLKNQNLSLKEEVNFLKNECNSIKKEVGINREYIISNSSKAFENEEKIEELKNEKLGDQTDLTKIEGIGPKIQSILKSKGIRTFADLSKAKTKDLKEYLEENSLSYHDPSTWSKQAKMAAEGQWEELEKWQDELDGGKVK